MSADNLGNRMKSNYEDRSRYYLTRRTPVIVRIDGQAFHTYTRKFRRPFDPTIISAMIASASMVASRMQGFKLGYVQSDEASFLLTDYDTLETGAWFDYNKSKIETISASTMAAAWAGYVDTMALACFDARSFNIPVNEVSNYFLWRMQDWHRNSVSMYAQSHFSHKELEGKNIPTIHEMLHTIGCNWTTDLNATIRNGTLILRDLTIVHTCQPKYTEIDRYVKETGIYE